MEFIEGVFIDDIESIKKMGFDPLDILKTVNEEFYNMIFK